MHGAGCLPALKIQVELKVMPKERVYRISFMNQDKVYEVYASHVGASGMPGFIEISHLLFGEASSVVLDPSEEHLKNEFRRVKRSYIPMYAVIRIDEVEKPGHARVTEAPEGKGNITPFPFHISGSGGSKESPS